MRSGCQMTIQEHSPARLKALPGEPGLPLVGNSLKFASGKMAASHEWCDKYGAVSWTRAVGQLWVNVEGPDACGAVLQDRDRVYDASGWTVLIGPFFDRG